MRGVDTLAEVTRRVQARLAETPKGAWVIGHRWDQSLWPGGAYPTAAVLDAVASDRPVWLRRIDGHAGWANSEALRRAKVDKSTNDPKDGQILRDQDGRPTGVLIDGAMNLVDAAIPEASRSEVERRILAAQRSC